MIHFYLSCWTLVKHLIKTDPSFFSMTNTTINLIIYLIPIIDNTKLQDILEIK
jgi:hypothetical protein